MAYSEYSKRIHSKANDVAKKLLVKLSENKEILIPNNMEPTEDEQKKINEDTADFAINIIKFLSDEDVTANYGTFAIDKIIENLTGLKQFINGSLSAYEDEFLSRSYGVKNDEGKYRKEEITIKELVLKLSEIREVTGNNNADFFNEVAPEMPKPEVSPYQDTV